MKEPTTYQKLLWWLEYRWYDLVQWSSGQVARRDKLMSLLPSRLRLWVWSLYEWSVCRTFNDGPDECYWPWKKYWQMVKEGQRDAQNR